MANKEYIERNALLQEINKNRAEAHDESKAIVDELRKRGLSNGGSLGYHSGLMDSAADLIESQQTEIQKLQAMLDSKNAACVREAFDKAYNFINENWDFYCRMYRSCDELPALRELFDKIANGEELPKKKNTSAVLQEYVALLAGSAKVKE